MTHPPTGPKGPSFMGPTPRPGPQQFGQGGPPSPPVPPGPPGWMPQSPPPPRSGSPKKLWWIIAGAVAVAIIAVVTVLVLGTRESAEPPVPSPSQNSPAPSKPSSEPPATSPAPSSSEPAPTSVTPTAPTTTAPTPPPDAKAEYVEFGRFSLAVPEGWSVSQQQDGETNATVVTFENPASPLLRFRFYDHPSDLDETHRPGSLCAMYNKPLLDELEPVPQWFEGMPLSFSGDVAVAECGARGVLIDEGIEYDYSWTEFFDRSTRAGIIMQQRTNWEAMESDESQFAPWSEYYECALQTQTGAESALC